MKFQKFYEIFEKYGFSESVLRVKNSKKFQYVWFGVTQNPHKDNELLYWFESEEDNLSCDFSSLDDFVNAKIFDGNSLKEIWDNIEIIALDCISPEEYTIPTFEKSIVFNCKHKELSTYEELKADRKAWLKFLSVPIICLVLSLAYFVCSLTVITFDKTKNIIVSSILMGILIIFIFVCFTIADIQRAKRIKNVYSFDKSITKSTFYKNFEKYCNDSFNEAYRYESFNEEGLSPFGPFESCGFLKIKDTYIIFAESPSENLEMVFLNNYVKVWNKKNNVVKTYLYDDYKDIEHLLNKIKNQIA